MAARAAAMTVGHSLCLRRFHTAPSDLPVVRSSVIIVIITRSLQLARRSSRYAQISSRNQPRRTPSSQRKPRRSRTRTRRQQASRTAKLSRLNPRFTPQKQSEPQSRSSWPLVNSQAAASAAAQFVRTWLLVKERTFRMRVSNWTTARWPAQAPASQPLAQRRQAR